jgi:predicted membrane channel-forming protein YqfA (hemolysin III family)
MTDKKIDTYTPSLISTAVLGLLTLIIIFNADKWAVFIPLFVALGFMGLTISGKQRKQDDTVSRARWQSSAVALLISLAIYITAGIIKALGNSTDEQRLGLVLMAFVIIPFYFGAAQLLSLLLIRQK